MPLPNPNPPFQRQPVEPTDPASLPLADLKIDDATGDMVLPPVLAVGVDAVRQRLLIRLKFFRGEWFLDLRQGLPYYEQVLVKTPSLPLVESVFRRAILSTPGVLSIQKMSVTFLRPERRLVIDPLEILLTNGTVFRAQPDEFIVEVESGS